MLWMTWQPCGFDFSGTLLLSWIYQSCLKNLCCNYNLDVDMNSFNTDDEMKAAFDPLPACTRYEKSTPLSELVTECNTALDLVKTLLSYLFCLPSLPFGS